MNLGTLGTLGTVKAAGHHRVAFAFAVQLGLPWPSVIRISYFDAAAEKFVWPAYHNLAGARLGYP
jgi:hypothetical protein